MMESKPHLGHANTIAPVSLAMFSLLVVDRTRSAIVPRRNIRPFIKVIVDHIKAFKQQYRISIMGFIDGERAKRTVWNTRRFRWGTIFIIGGIALIITGGLMLNAPILGIGATLFIIGGVQSIRSWMIYFDKK